MRWKTGKRQTKKYFIGEKASKVGQPTPIFPLAKIIPSENRLVNHLNSPEHITVAMYGLKKGGAEEKEIPSLFFISKRKSSCPCGLNLSSMCLFTLLLHKWDNPACHLTQSLMHTWLFFPKQSSISKLQRWSVLVWRVEKERVFDSISSSWQEKSNSLCKKTEIFFKWKHRRLQNRKAEWFELEKGAM